MKKSFEKYLEEVSEEEFKEITITVKDLINYLNKFKPETKVILDKDGWSYMADLHGVGEENKDEIISSVFQPYEDVLFIQN